MCLHKVLKVAWAGAAARSLWSISAGAALLLWAALRHWVMVLLLKLALIKLWMLLQALPGGEMCP